MTQKSILLIILLSSSIAFNISAQSFSSTKAKLKKANSFFQAEKYHKAIPLYLMVLDKEDNSKAKINLAEAYRKVNNWMEAEYWYGQIVHLPDAKPIYSLYYGKALQANGKCDLAKEWFQKYSEEVFDDFRGRLLAQACDNSSFHPKFLFCKNCYEVIPLPFNTKYDDNGPVFYKNKLLYNQEYIKNNRTNLGNQYQYYTQINQIMIDTLDGQNFEYIYNEPRIFLKDKTKSLGFTTFNSDYTQMYFTERIHFEDKRSYSKTHSAQLIDSSWSYTGLLPFNSDEYSVMHPLLVNNGQRIYFASDTPGGFGGMDLYYSNFIDNKWSNPVNLGSIVNTEGNEMYPSHHSASGLLYFSSDAHLFNQELDIYSTNPSENFSKITRLPAPVNTEYDDYGIIFNKNQTFGYFVSNRQGGQGYDDIYGLRINMVYVQLKIIEKEYQEPISKANIESSGVGGRFKSNQKGIVSFPMSLDDCKTFKISKEGFTTVEKTICTTDLKANDRLEIVIELTSSN